MLITLKSKPAEIYNCILILDDQIKTFTFEFNHPDRILKGRGEWDKFEDNNSSGIILNFLLLNRLNNEGQFKSPENSIPYTGRRLIRNPDNLSYTLEGYFDPEDVILTLYNE